MNKDLKDFYPHHRRLKLARNKEKKCPPRLTLAVISVSFIVFMAWIVIWSAGFSFLENKLPHLSHSFPAAYGNPDEETDIASLSEEITTPEKLCTEDKVKKGDTFETVSLRNGIERVQMLAMLEAARPVHNLNQVTAGRSFKFTFTDSTLESVEYEINEDRTLVLEACDSLSWKAGLEETVYQTVERELSGSIESSLYQTVVDVCGMPELALKLSEIYAWQIDFHNDIRKGDTFKLIYEEKIHPKGTKKVERIVAAVFRNGAKDFWAIRFANLNGKTDYFDLAGASLRRKFLRSPFTYMPRISSRFSHSRFHPILKIFRPHLGVDYAAPTGTPVLALGDGRITHRGWNGGFGRYIVIKHNGMFATSYGHLSRYSSNIKVGSYVTQGHVIGYVGSSGLATGPHLDFRFYKNSQPVNPLTVDIPAGDPIHKSIFNRYAAYRDEMVKRLERIDSQYRPPLAKNENGEMNDPPLAAASSED
ncbi:MAG TPA: peptidoglycan DD-metalloendopeptidase family protein [archaeon]|nr:peptidoglycan DD-metalloendopeptidase family protein [archaeon]